MKTMTGCLAALLLVLMAMTGLAQEETLWIRFSEDWLNLLKVQTDAITVQEEACQAIIDFHEDTTWENLVDARVKTDRVIRTLKSYTGWELVQSMTEEDYQKLEQMNIDVGDVQIEYTLYNEKTRFEYETMDLPEWTIYYQPVLIESVFDQNMLDMMAETAAIKLAYLKLEMKERYVVNNIILLEVPEAESVKIDAWVKQYVPVITDLYEKPFESVNDAVNEIVRLLDEGEETLLLDSEKLTGSEVMLENSVEPELIDLKNQPFTLPYPENWDSEGSEYLYFWKDESGNIQLDLNVKEHMPEYQLITIPNADRKFFEDYITLLEACGYPASGREEDTCLYVFKDGMRIMMEWQDDTMTIYAGPGQVFFAPIWYILQR